MSVRQLVFGCAVVLLGSPVLAAEPNAGGPPPGVNPPAATSVASPPAVPPDPAKIVAYRQVLMEGAGKHMKAASMIVKGDVPRREDLVGHATALHDVSIGLVDLFPAGTGPGKQKTEAKPEVWSAADKFKAAAVAYETETLKLVEISKTGDFGAYQQQFGAVGKSCGGCHDGFRVKD